MCQEVTGPVVYGRHTLRMRQVGDIIVSLHKENNCVEEVIIVYSKTYNIYLTGKRILIITYPMYVLESV